MDAAVAPGGGWEPRELLDEYARLSAQRRAIEEKLEQLKAALTDVATARGLDVLEAPGGRMRFRRVRVLGVLVKDEVIAVLERRGLLSRFVTLRTQTLAEVAGEDPSLRAELGEAVEDVERVTATFVPSRRRAP